MLSVNRRCGSRILAAANQHAAELYEQHPGVIPLEAPAEAPEGAITWINAIERGLTIDADPDQLFRILLNLVRNAAQALEGQPQSDAATRQIRVTGRREGAVTIIEVSDTDRKSVV